MRRNQGFTAIELMVVIAIAAILAALALPSFNQMIIRWQMRQDLNALIDTVYFARSEAVKWGSGNIRVRKIPTCPGTRQDWSCGWQVLLRNVPTPLPPSVPADGVLRVVKTNVKNDIMTVRNNGLLDLNQWGNPNAGFGINIKHNRDSSTAKCLDLSSGGRLEVSDGVC